MNSVKAPRLLVIVPDVVGKKMAGPGMRYVEITKALAPYMPITFAIGVEGSGTIEFKEDVTVAIYSHVDELKKLIDDCDVIFCQVSDRNALLYAVSTGKRIIYDLYNALPVETVGAERISGYTGNIDKDREFKELLSYFEFCARTGSYFVCSNPHQQDYWLGFIMASRGLLPSTLNKRELSDIIGFTPFGMEAGEPKQTHHPLRSTKGIKKNDFVLLWAGGIWDWFDANTPIQAVAELAPNYPDLKLVFYGTTHPNSTVGKPKNVERAIALAKELGVFDTQVFFHEGWVPVNERANYLLEADVAISSHVSSLETAFAFRTRILDHFWAGLPSIVSSGDSFSEYIEVNKLGIVTPPKDLAAIKQAMVTLHNDAKLRVATKNNIEAIREDWRWPATTRTLRDYILNDIMQTPLRELPDVATKLPVQTLAGYLKQSSGVNKLRNTKAWPVIKKAKRLLVR